MSDEDFQKLLATIGRLTPVQLATLDASVRGRLDAPPTAPGSAPDGTKTENDRGVGSIAELDAQFAASPSCPQCQSTAVGKWGTASGLRRYRCKSCKATFNALTGTPLAQLHKKELWIGHGQALVEGISLRKVAARLDIDLTTAFRWRHRFLKAPKAQKPKVLSGIVEADETYFLKSNKGSRTLDRKARKRGGKASKRGLSAEQVAVLIARDRNKVTTDHILPDRSTRSLSDVLESVIAKSAIFVSDAAPAFCAFANAAKLPHASLNLSAGERKWGDYHIQNVNNYDSRLKSWMRRFNGVATKYLDSYLGWHRTNDRDGSTLSARSMLAAAWG